VSNRTVIVIAVIAAALFAFIYFYDRDRMTTGELEGRKDRVFAELKSDLVDRIEIQGSSGQKVALVREAKPKGEGAEASWRIESPKKLAADDAAVREILSALDFLVKKRVVVGSGERAKPQYGLEKPAVSASFTMRGVATSFRIGTGKGTGETVYVAVDGHDDELYAVEKEFADSMDKGLDDLRDKHLVTASVDSAIGLTVSRSGEPVSLSRKSADDPWIVSRGGAEMLAAADQVSSLLSDIGGVRAEEYVADSAADAALAEYGLDKPSYEISVALSKGESLALLLGKPCPGEKRVYASIAGSGTVACVSDEIATSAGRPLARFAETRPLVFADDEVEKLTLTRGAKSLTFERDEEKGFVASGHADVLIDRDAVAKMLQSLRETRAREVIAGKEATASLGAPIATVALTLEAGKPALALSLFASDSANGAPAGQRARRGEENGVLFFDKDLDAALQVDLLAYRDKTVKNGDAGDAVALSIEGPAAQKLERKEGAWKFVSNSSIEADGAAARSVAELVAEAKVERFVADRAEAAHGFAAPYAKVTARFEKKSPDGKPADKSGEPESATLEIGAPAGDDGSRYARFAGEGLVFVLKKESVALVAQPLASRDLISVDPSELVKVAIAANGTTVTATREGETWKADNTSIDGKELERRIGELGALRAIRGEAFGAAVGFEAPALKIEAWTQKQLDEKAEPTALSFGAKTADPKENGYTARKSGADVTMIVPARLVDEIIALMPAPPAQP